MPPPQSKDQASFRPSDIEAVHGRDIVCFQTAKRDSFAQPIDAHHILGRGNPRDPSDRIIHGSIFNLAWLRRDVHTGPLRDAPDQAAVYLRVAMQHVMNAVGRGSYQLRDEDLAFSRKANEWLEENGSSLRYPELML